MSDNIQLNSGSGGATLAADEVGGVHYQIVKLAYGPLDSATVVSAAAPLPVSDGGGSLTVDVSSMPTTTVEATALDIRGLDAASDSVAAVQSGTWNIGNISGTVSLPTGAATEATLAALNGKVTACDTGSIAGTVTARLASDAVQAGAASLVPKFAKISAAASGDNALVSAVAGKKIRVLAMALVATDALSLYFNDGTADLFADSSNSVPLDETGAAGSGGFVLGFNPVGWFETADVGRPLNVNLSGAVGVCGSLVYVEV